MDKKEYICERGKKSKIVIEDLTIDIKNDATLILGFAGIGLIGPIVANQLIEQIPDIKEIGFELRVLQKGILNFASKPL